ncbi:MAG: DUF1801 domain-containing protein [Thermoplasmata archaeon]
MGRRDPRVDAYIAQIPASLAPIAKALRTAVRQSAPELTERIWMGVPTWFGAGQVCYLADYRDHVNLGFFEGARLADPQKLLEGTGKSLRHVKVRSTAQARSRPLAALLASAARLRGPPP